MKRGILLAAVLASLTAAATASDIGSVVNSFPARIYGHGHSMMPVGMEYAFDDLWIMYVDGVLARRSYPTGSVIATYQIGPWGMYGLAFDGSYFWTALTPSLFRSELYKVNPTTMSVAASFVVNHNYALRHLTWDGSRFWTGFLEDKYSAHLMDAKGSILNTFSIPYKYWAGVAYVDNIPDGPRLFEGVWGTSPEQVCVYKVPERKLHYRFTPRIPESHCRVGCWDGTYLWTFGNWSPAGNEFCYQVIGWEPGIGVSPASLGKVKALFR